MSAAKDDDKVRISTSGGVSVDAGKLLKSKKVRRLLDAAEAAYSGAVRPGPASRGSSDKPDDKPD